MSSINKIILLGFVGKDPEIRSMQNGKKAASFSLATNETWFDKASNKKHDKTEWHKVVVFNDNLVSLVEKSVKKGVRVYVEGMIESRTWKEKTYTEVVVKAFRGEIIVLDKPSATNQEVAVINEEKVNASLDDDIPF